MRFEIDLEGARREVTVQRTNGGFSIVIDARTFVVDAARVEPHVLSLIVTESLGVETRSVAHSRSGPMRSHQVLVARLPRGMLSVAVGAVGKVAAVGHRRVRSTGRLHDAPGSGRIVAPMPGKVVRVLVRPGERVVGRQPLVIVEAMKMENTLRAPREGVVAEVYTHEGTAVETGSLLILME